MQRGLALGPSPADQLVIRKKRQQCCMYLSKASGSRMVDETSNIFIPRPTAYKLNYVYFGVW